MQDSFYSNFLHTPDNYDPEKSYGVWSKAILYGCVVESLVDNNTYRPMTWDGAEEFNLDVSHWRIIKGNPHVWAINNNKPAGSIQYPNNGMGRVVLKKDKGFAIQLSQTNTTYIIQYDFDLNDPCGDSPVTIPASCILQFDGGSLKNGVVVGQNTGIKAGLHQIFGPDLSLNGTWNIQEAYPEWYGAKGDGITDDFEALQNTVNSFPLICLRDKTYISNSVINIGANKTIFGKGSILKCLLEGCEQLMIIGNNTLIKGIKFENIAKGYPAYGLNNGGVNSTNIVYRRGIVGIHIEECSFKNAICGVYIHSGCKDVVIKGCNFINFVSLPNDNQNPLNGCAGGYGICLDADNSDSLDLDNIYRVTISNCTFSQIQRHCIYIQCVYGCLIENNYFYANRNIIHPTPYDAVMMVYNTIDLRVSNNVFQDALEAMHLEKIGVLPYNPNELRHITIENNTFSNCGDDTGENGVIGADFGDHISLVNNYFNHQRGKMGAIIGLNHNRYVSIANNHCEVSSNCAMNANLVRYNSSDIKNVIVLGNMADFTNTGKQYDMLLYTDFSADGLIVKNNITIDGNFDGTVYTSNVTNKIVSDNVNIISSQ